MDTLVRWVCGAGLVLGLFGGCGGCRGDRGDRGEADDSATSGGSTSDGGSGSADTGSDTGGEPDEGVHYLTPTEHLVRIAMALRGNRPSPEDLAAVDADPAALRGIVDAYLETPQFGETIRDLHNEAFLLLSDYIFYPAGFPSIDALEGVDPYVVNRSVTEAPLRLIEHVIMEDRPYSEIVTADYTLANGRTAIVWGLPHDGEPDAWEVTHWVDGRQNAGVLSDSWVFARHSTTVSNANRGRANAISRALLCHDFTSLNVDIDSSVDLSDPDAVANAVVQDPACAACHQALDPLAGYFGDFVIGFAPGTEAYPVESYSEDFFGQELDVQLRDPAYFGVPAVDLEGLGATIAADPRFSLCAARRFYAYFHQLRLEDVPFERAAELQASFIDSGMNAKELTREIVLADEFRISHSEEETSDVQGVRKTRPVQLAQLIRQLTGFTWRGDLSVHAMGTPDLLADSFFGYGVLAGGIDSVFVTSPSHTYNATASLVLRTLAAEAASFVVESDFSIDDRGARRLLDRVDADVVDETQIRKQLARLHQRILAESIDPDAPEIDETWSLFKAALDHGGSTHRAWKVTLAAMLQDVRIAYH